ncbi:riboflavin kinase [Spiroplasma endosymbiont of Aspidapion aeneum]|uniref:riboflavin kinase n=1 Tax=Spiroplasma endosymbiont of Aspidapion aeneum TaxID=3066276 RepID=UPI00313ABB54
MDISTLKTYINNFQKIKFIFITNFLLVNRVLFEKKYDINLTKIIISKNINYCNETDFFCWKESKYEIIESCLSPEEINEIYKNYDNVIFQKELPIDFCNNKIKNFFENGDFTKIKDLENVDYYLSSKVAHGNQLGRQIGFPTANLVAQNELTIPEGVYSTITSYNKTEYWGATCVRWLNHKLLIETYILDFNDNLYDKILTINFKDKIRNNISVDSIEKLKELIGSDVENIRKRGLL